ncbi:histone-lysine N-methyltransferase ASH1L-like isoform X2 [Dunckerocampus dactyliophorus]|uniref:histone-lysine N-methyltransferase ASH1L-like isoform X2 n=1 Tax=Dunckerocampus dactyliophorus TaxID=161453 RepID=UPI00240654DA|nr:histone-lysine N-methyltransferase ASH1L-like isoform X2 [Dunckerocampus dactyliophorus]
MDQRMKGGTPPTTDSTLDASPAPENLEQDQDKRKRKVEGEDSDTCRKEERRGKKREGDKGAVLELLIEGRCGGAGQQQLQICGKDTSCPDGNVRLRIGVQAKRTKKPPKILESYVCKPTIRTYQRQVRGGALPSRSSSNLDDANRETLSGSDGVQTASKQTATAASSPLGSPLLSPSLSAACPTASASASAIASSGTKSAKQVPLKLAVDTEATSAGPSESVKKEKTPSIDDQPVPAGLKLSLPSTDQKSSTPCTETPLERGINKKHNGVVQTKNQKGLSNGRCSEDNIGDTPKIKAGKHSSSSPVPSVDTSKTPTSSSQTQRCLPDRSNSPSTTAKSKSSPTLDMSSVQLPVRDPSLYRSKDKKKDKERKIRKEKRKERKPKGDGLEIERVKGDSRKEEMKRKKKDKGKDGKSRHSKERPMSDHKGVEELKNGEKAEKNKDKIRKDDAKSSNSDKLDKTYKSRSDEGDVRDNICKPVKEAEHQATACDDNKSKEKEGLRRSTVLPKHPTSLSALPPLSPQSLQEQDSRPLKKRKARRPSWTKLVHRAQRAENQKDDSQTSFFQNPQAPNRQTDELTHSSPTRSPTNSAPSVSSPIKPSSPKLNHSTLEPSPPAAPKSPATPTRKRGRPKSHSMIYDEPPLRLSPEEIAFLGCDNVPQNPIPESSPKKRGRPRKQPMNPTDVTDESRDPHPSSEKGNRQLKIRKLINERKKRKKRRLHKVTSGFTGKEASRIKGAENNPRAYKSSELIVPTLSALSSSFGTKLGPLINVSKRGTIYMGKRRGRKPKAQTAHLKSNSFTQSSLFTHPTETSLFISQQSQQPPAHPFPSPSLTHSSGAQSPYSEGSVTEPTSTLVFPPPFSLPSPSSSCTSPRPLSCSSVSPFVKKSCPCQGRHHFLFHQSSCKLSSPTPPLHPTPGSPGHLKDPTPSPRSESHSEETLPSDSGIGTDNNSVCERAEMRGARGMLRLGQGSGGIVGGPKNASLVDSSSHFLMARHKNPVSNSTTMERHRHRHKRRDYSCPSSCACLCPCPGHNNKCTHSDFFPCLGHNALKKQKNKHKKKHQQLLMQDPEFLTELEELIGQFSEVHIGRRAWARAELTQGFEGSGNMLGGRRHHSSHAHRSNVFRINLNGFYSPHPPSFAANPSFPPQPFYPCQPVHCNRKPERRQCGCPSKFPESIENMGFYSNYPPATTLYHHLPGSYPLPTPHQYAPQQPHHAHFLLNPARFHRRRSRLLREGALGGEIEGSGGGLNLGYTSSLPCDCGRSEHKHKHRERPSERNMDDEVVLHDHEEGEVVARESFSSSKSRLSMGQGGGKKGTRGMGGVLSKESPWLRENGNNSFSAATSSSSLSERSRPASLFSVGLGSSHLSSFGGGWGGLAHSWTKPGGATFPKSSWGSFSGHTGRRMIPSEHEDDDEEDIHPLHLNRTSPSPTHTNLFTSSTVARGGRGLGSTVAARNLGSGGRLWRKDQPAWTERREAGLQGDSRSRGQLKGVPTAHREDGKNKRRPGRPRKRPLPSALSPPVPPPDLLPNNNNNNNKSDARGRREGNGPERDGVGVRSVQQVTDSELQAKRKRGRKRKHDASPCHQSVADEEPECCDTPAEGYSYTAVEQPASHPVGIQRDERGDGPPRKTFLRAGLYSDDYKTTDPPSQLFSRGSTEYKPGEREYSLLPAPIHVGKYLRLKRINFQLPYDVMWLWQHSQLQRQPAFPLKRKRRYCRVKERTIPSQHAVEESSSDLASLFPHLDMEPLTGSERSFVVTHRVFLVRNWELVRERQIRLRMERRPERDSEEEERDWRVVCGDGASGDDSHIKSGP